MKEDGRCDRLSYQLHLLFGFKVKIASKTCNFKIRVYNKIVIKSGVLA